MREIDRYIEDLENLVKTESAVSYSADKLVDLLSQRPYGEQELQHNIQVFGFASALLEAEEVSDQDTKLVVHISSVVHDFGRYLEDPSIARHTEITGEQLEVYIDPSKKYLLDRITRCTQRHSLSSKEKPETLEEKILFDADNLTLFTEFGFKRWFFKAEDWGHVSNVQDADQKLKELYDLARSGQFLYLPSSVQLLQNSFYANVFDDKK